MEAEVRPTEQASPPTGSANTHSSTAAPPTTTLDEIFRRLSTYPFSADPDFQSGLATILGSDDTSTITREEAEARHDTILEAQCFYFTRKYKLPSVDYAAYKSWLRTHDPGTTDDPNTTTNPSSSSAPIQPTQLPPTTTTTTPPATVTTSSPPEPPYPTSFAHIVDLITNNKPIPGIEDVPDIVLAAGSSPPNQTPRRRKPWEKEGGDDGDEVLVGAVDSGGGGGGGDVVRMLQPITTSEMPETEANAEEP